MSEICYRIEREPYQMLIFGTIPVCDLVELSKTAERLGMTIVDAVLTMERGATIAFRAPRAGEIGGGNVGA